MPISWEIDTLCKDIEKGKVIEKTFRTKDLLAQFDVKVRDISEISRITIWLNERGVKCEPDLYSVNLDATVKLAKYSIDAEKNAAKKMLLLSLLPCANINPKNLVYFNEKEKMIDVVTAMKLRNIDFGLIVSSSNGDHIKSSGFITAKSIIKYIIRLKEKSDNEKDDYIAKDFCENEFYQFETNKQLIEVIDKINDDIKKNVVILNKKKQVTGIANYAQIMKELYPYSKPFFVVSLIESALSEIIRSLNYPKTEIAEVMQGDGEHNVKRRANPEPEWLTMYEKILLLHQDRLSKIECKQLLKSSFKIIYNELIRVNEISNIIAHYRPDPISEEDLNLIYTTQEKLKEITI